MGLTKQHEALLVAGLYLAILWFWTLPLQENPLPYGEVDAASHYAVAEYTTSSDRSITTLPYYIDVRYGDDNKFKEHTLWYPPPFHTALAMAAVFGGNIELSIFILNAILCSLVVLGVYFLMRSLYGFEVGFVSAALVGFSLRDALVFMWGQWPERFGFAFLPLILYCFYHYASSHLDGNRKPIYAYLLGLLLAANLFIHPMTFFHSVAALLFVGIFLLIKERRIFFHMADVGIALVIFVLLISVFPFQTMNVLAQTSDVNDPAAIGDWSRLFSWYRTPETDVGAPAAYYSYSAMVAPLWTALFVASGILFLLLKRDRKAMVMLGWLVSLYVMLHLDIFGIGRGHRSLSATAHIFFPLMVLGALFLASFVPENQKNLARRWAPWVLGLIVLFFIVPPVYSALSTAYQGAGRITPEQFELSVWMRDLPPKERLFHAGSLSLAKTRWLSMAGRHYVLNQGFEQGNFEYVILDASDAAKLGNQQFVQALQQQAQLFANVTPTYQKGLIWVYQTGRG
ncbi:glycosyltransferase family 39 protein [Candidatus Woesearchaeota archaeon]|nr:glycosyltransferase family 39 protein [Candidatus Woesearchaeota archaeon]